MKTIAFNSTQVSEMITALEIFNNIIPGHIYIKDTNGCYLGANNVFTNTVKHRSSNAIGKNDFELWGEYAEELAPHDNFVFQNKKELIRVEKVFDSFNQPAVYLSKKIPFFDDAKNLIGLLGLSIDITQKENFKLGEMLIDAIDDHIILQKDISIMLSKKQSGCLYYTLHGLSAKEIGKILHISPRTVEAHLDKIKFKFNCRNKKELISKALSLGYNSAIPK